MMNEKEDYKAPGSPLRLFFDVGLSVITIHITIIDTCYIQEVQITNFNIYKMKQVGPLDGMNSADDQYRMFSAEMEHFFQRHPKKKIGDYELVILYSYTYMVC